jgi:hypothetical protein
MQTQSGIVTLVLVTLAVGAITFFISRYRTHRGIATLVLLLATIIAIVACASIYLATNTAGR